MSAQTGLSVPRHHRKLEKGVNKNIFLQDIINTQSRCRGGDKLTIETENERAFLCGNNGWMKYFKTNKSKYLCVLDNEINVNLPFIV